MGEIPTAVKAEIEKPFRLNRKQEIAVGFMTDPIARHHLLLGGSRCLGGASLIETSAGEVTLKSLFDRARPFEVNSLSREGRGIVTDAEAPFIKGVARLKHVVLGNGKWFDAHPIHRVIGIRAGVLSWVFVRDLGIGDLVLSSSGDRLSAPCLPGSNLEPAPSASDEDDPHCSQTGRDSRSCCPERHCSCDEQPRLEEEDGQGVAPSPDGAPKCKRGDCSCRVNRSGAEPSDTPSTSSHHLAKHRAVRHGDPFLAAQHPSCEAIGERTRRLLLGAQSRARTVLNSFRSGIAQSPHLDDHPNRTSTQCECLLNAPTPEAHSRHCPSLRSPVSSKSAAPLHDGDTFHESDRDDLQSDICLGHDLMFSALSSDNPFGLTVVLESSFKEAPEEYYDFTVPSTAIYAAGGTFHHNSGKTFLCIKTMILRALIYPKSRHLSLRLHRVTAEKYLWKQTIPDVIEKCFRGIGFEYNHSKMILTCPNGSTLWVGGLDEGKDSDGLLGSDWNTVHFDEANEMLPDGMQKARTRLSLKSWNAERTKLCVNRSFATVNPTYKTHHLYRTYVEHFDIFNGLPMSPEQSSMYNWCRINPCDNLENLSDGYLRELESLSPENRKRFLEGEWSEESKDALFKSADINRSRVKTFEEVSAINFDKIVVGVDPSVTSGAKADMTGIVVVGWTRPKSTDRRSSGQYYLLDDRSLNGTPDEWAQAVYEAYTHWKADIVVGEANNGGDLVEKNIRSVSRVIPFKKVWASRGKAIRAQPVAAVCSRGDLHVAVSLPELEGEMVGWNPDSGEPSPNRLDAMVWGVSEAMGSCFKQARIIGAV